MFYVFACPPIDASFASKSTLSLPIYVPVICMSCKPILSSSFMKCRFMNFVLSLSGLDLHLVLGFLIHSYQFDFFAPCIYSWEKCPCVFIGGNIINYILRFLLNP